MRRLLSTLFVLGVVGPAMAYTNGFTLDMNTAGATGWSDPAGNGTTFVTGETTPADSPAYNPAPSVGAPGGGWMRLNSPQANGIALAIYDGAAGGGGADPVDYTIQVDMFVVATGTERNQSGVALRWGTGDGNFPFEVYHAINNGNPGYGYRCPNGYSSTSTNLFPAETQNRWVTLKVSVYGDKATVSVDRDRDGTFDYTTATPITGLNTSAGKAGLFYVINNGGNRVDGKYSYFDNFKYTPIAAGVEDWSIY